MPLPVCHTTGFLLHFDERERRKPRKVDLFHLQGSQSEPQFLARKNMIDISQISREGEHERHKSTEKPRIIGKDFRKSICSPIHALSVPFFFTWVSLYVVPCVSSYATPCVPLGFQVGSLLRSLRIYRGSPPMCVPLRSL